MTVFLELYVVPFLVFCRIGTALMLLPGWSSARVPRMIRLLIAIALSLCISPIVGTPRQGLAQASQIGTFVEAIAIEIVYGAALGMCARIYFIALQFSASAMVTLIGYGALPATAIDDTEPQSSVGSLVTLGATALIFATDMHWLSIKALVGSYDTHLHEIRYETWLVQIVDFTRSSFLTSLQLMAPFLLYSLLANLAFGLANRMIPNIPAFFISMPFILAGGFLIIYIFIGRQLEIFSVSFSKALGTL